MRKLLLRLAVLLVATHVVQAADFDSAGVKIHYTDQGAGQPVILIHGLAASGEMNWGAPGIIANLARNYRVIALDCRGHGQSDKPTAEGSYGVQMTKDVIRLMDHLHIPAAYLVGYSLGGMIALKLAVTHPARVRSAVLGGMGWLQADTPLQHFWENMGGGKASGTSSDALLHGFGEFAVTAAEVKAIKLPVQVIVGDRDPCRRLYVEPLQKIRPDIPVHIVPNAGHLGCVIKPEFKTELNTALSRNATPR